MAEMKERLEELARDLGLKDKLAEEKRIAEALAAEEKRQKDALENANKKRIDLEVSNLYKSLENIIIENAIIPSAQELLTFLNNNRAQGNPWQILRAKGEAICIDDTPDFDGNVYNHIVGIRNYNGIILSRIIGHKPFTEKYFDKGSFLRSPSYKTREISAPEYDINFIGLTYSMNKVICAQNKSINSIEPDYHALEKGQIINLPFNYDAWNNFEETKTLVTQLNNPSSEILKNTRDTLNTGLLDFAQNIPGFPRK